MCKYITILIVNDRLRKIDAGGHLVLFHDHQFLNPLGTLTVGRTDGYPINVYSGP